MVFAVRDLLDVCESKLLNSWEAVNSRPCSADER